MAPTPPALSAAICAVCWMDVSCRRQSPSFYSYIESFYSPEDPTAEHVYNMLMRNFNRVYRGEEDELGNFIEGSRAPWGLYMHAAWFFGQPWHYDGYKMFIAEITNNTAYPDVYIVPVEAGLR